MKFFLAIVAALVVASSASVEHASALGGGATEQMFLEWVQKHGVLYGSFSETQDRFEVFKSNLAIIDELNANPNDAAVYAATRFADLTPGEFADQYLSQLPETYEAEVTESHSSERGSEILYAAHGKGSAPANDLPDQFDWQDEGMVARVKNQASCGSCWAFSTTGSLESALAISTGEVVELSEQQVYLCTLEQACACSGGWPWAAIQAVVDFGGVISEEALPYQNPPFGDCIACTDGSDWQRDNCPQTSGCNCYCEAEEHLDDIVGSFSAVKAWPEDDEEALVQGVYENGAISICLQVGGWAQFYDSGVASPDNCGGEVDHAVVLTGWGYDDDADAAYFRIKNSWSTAWGEDGYFRLIRDGSNRCSVSDYAVAGVV